ncbi:protein Shroom1 [Rhinichthys klamathensis goyatoka]|uniref:protein Shroom1 n=1 Tax=Rhinichthys klamathensis goyatoka TaxID=3034132 RepID=UPI0024B5DD93|nr:protein Shroom1 [Rhinichthys klamathensis goyatoka]
MDSYNFHFERMSNLDLHPLSLPVSRLSPAKSSSSIDQYTHHHGKGDSAYSSFSGGSTVPDYPSPFLLDEIQSQSLHYTDLKCVRAKYSPTCLDSDSKSMDHIYRSMDTVAQQHRRSSVDFSSIGNPSVHKHPLPPPPPPTRLNSFVTTRNLENSRARQSPEGQLADVSTLQQTVNPEVSGVRTEPVHGRAFSQLKDHLKQEPVDKILDPPKPRGITNRSPLQTCQPDYLSGHSENQRKRSHSAYGGPVSGNQCFVSSCRMPQNMISGSIQHKGQFYFVTGVFKSSEPSVMQGVVEDSASVDTSSEWSYKAQRRRQSCPDGPSGKLFFQEEHKFSIQNEVVEHPNNKAIKSEETCEGVEDQRVMSRETGMHHSTSHPIFYCGPEDKSVSTVITPALIKEDPTSHPKKEEEMTRDSRWPQLNIPSDKISKETTPLLYHLTGANRASYTDKFKNNNDCGKVIKNQDSVKDKQKAENDGQAAPSGEYRQSEVPKDQPNEFFYPCGTLDDSYKKYYKEKLKDAQSKVLRETSFKRRDLQLSRPHRIKLQTDKNLSVVPAGSPSLDERPNLDSPSPQEADQEYMKELGQEIDKIIAKETEKPQNIAQPQVPRVGCRKRLTADQKKLSHSEPEKLHQLADGPAHMTCLSLDNEAEGLLSESDHGLVAARRKMFETRGRAMSASNFSKSTLKHLQQKALVAYMERKTGQKVAEPQHPVPQVPIHRNSTSEWSSRHNSGSTKNLHRPLSAGQILDSVSSSGKYTQFTTAQPSCHSRQSSWREEYSKAGYSASVESLLDPPEQPKFPRTRSTSTPHAFQVRKHLDELSAIHNMAISSAQRKVEDTLVHHSRTASVHDERRVQVRAPRGKSMEELGVSIITKPDVLSKSSEQLDQLQGEQAMPGAEKRTVSVLAEGRHTPRKIVRAGEHTDNSQAGPGNPLLTNSAKHSSSNDDEIHIASHNGRKHKVDTVLSMPGHSTGPGGIMLEVSKEQEDFSPDKSKSSVSSQEVPLLHGVRTDPSLWTSTSEAKCSSPETPRFPEPQNAPPDPYGATETIPITTPPGIQESSLAPALNGEQDRNIKEEDGPLVIENRDKLKWEVLVQEVVSADQSLARTLYPITNRKTALMLMEQLLSEDNLLMEEHYKKKQGQAVNNPETAAHSTETPVRAKPWILPSSVNNESVLSNQKEELCNTEMDIIEKKRWLIARIEERLKCVEEVRSGVQGEAKANGVCGEAMEALVRESCVPAELERYTQFIGDLERVVSLLLCLSARLARVENALSAADDNMDTEEKQSLDNRYRLLCKQREDAKDLKDNLDRRERLVSSFLSKHLTDTQMQEYRLFIQTTASLLIRQKDLEEKQRLGEEQLEALLSTIPAP